MCSRAKCLITGLIAGLLTACGPASGPAGDPDTSQQVVPVVETSTTTDSQPENSAPQIISDPVTGTLPGMPYVYQPNVKDPDGDVVIWSLTQAPAGMNVDPETGLVLAESLPAGKHTVRLRVEDTNGGVDEQGFIIDLPAGPAIVSVPARYTYTGTNYVYQVDVLNISGTALQYAISMGPPGMEIDQDGLLQWTANQEGRIEVTLTVADAAGGIAEQQFAINVVSENDIIIISVPVTQAYVSRSYHYQLEALVGNDVDSWSLEEAPTGMTIDSGNVINWVPSTAGRYSVRVVAENNTGTRTTQEFDIDVKTQEKRNAEQD